jgi:hypothetical protein
MSNIYIHESKTTLQKELLLTKQLIEKYKAKVIAENLKSSPNQVALRDNKEILAKLEVEKKDILKALKNK